MDIYYLRKKTSIYIPLLDVVDEQGYILESLVQEYALLEASLLEIKPDSFVANYDEMLDESYDFDQVKMEGVLLEVVIYEIQKVLQSLIAISLEED